MPRAVRFDQYGGLDVLHIDDVPALSPKPGEVVVRVRAAGVNPGEQAIREGKMTAMAPSTFPSGEGTEFSGRVKALGDGVTDYAVGDAVIGFSDGRNAQADEVAIALSNVLPKPDGVEWGVAAVAPIAGATATSMVRSVRVALGDVVVVAGGAGGVGFAAVQLALRAGATVVATAAEADHDTIRNVGATPVLYGDGVQQRIRDAAPNGADVFLDTHGDGQADIAIALGVAPDRVDSIIDFGAGKRLGIRNEGMYQLPDLRGAIVEFVNLVAAGEVLCPVKARFPLEDVQGAYRALTEASGVGKVALDVSSDDMDRDVGSS